MTLQKRMTFVTLMFVLYLCVSAFSNERDDWTDKLTQLKHFAEEVKQDIIGLRIDVEQKLRQFKRKEFDWFNEYFRFKKLTRTKNVGLKEAQSKVGDLTKELENKNRDFRLNIHEYKMIHGGRRVPELNQGLWKSKDVSFRSNGPLKTKIDDGENIILTNTLENIGNGYDNYTGVFIAPVTGLYFFVLQLYCAGPYVHLEIRTDRGMYSWTRFVTYLESCLTTNTLIPLDKGDKVYVLKSSSSDYQTLMDGNELSNTFSGVLFA